MPDTAKVLNLQDYRRTAEIAKPSDGPSIATGHVSSDKGPTPKEAGLDDLYPTDTPSGGLVHHARRLLADAERYLQSARDLFIVGDVLGADNEISFVQADLPELFCCRELSEGFGLVILAMYYGLQNRHGNLLNSDQLFVFQNVVVALRSNIFVNLDAALDLIEQLDRAQFVTSSPDLEALSDVLTTEGFPGHNGYDGRVDEADRRGKKG